MQLVNTSSKFSTKQDRFWSSAVKSAPSALKHGHGVPSYLPAYKRWLTKRERARFGRLLATQDMMLTHYDGSRARLREPMFSPAVRRFEKYVSTFMARFAPKKLSTYRRFFKKSSLYIKMSTNTFRQTRPHNQSLTQTLYHMFAKRNGLAESAKYTKVLTGGVDLRTSRRSPEQLVKLHLQGDVARNDRSVVVSRQITPFSVGARGLQPTSSRSLRSHLPVVFLHWNMAIRNTRINAEFVKPRVWPAIGGRRLEWVNFKLAGSLVPSSEFTERFLKPVADAESKVGGNVRTYGQFMTKLERSTPFFLHRDYSPMPYYNMFTPASRLWRDFRGLRRASRHAGKTTIESQTRARQLYVRKEGHFMAVVRGGVGFPFPAKPLGPMTSGRLKPKSIYAHRTNKRWAGQRRYLMRMMGWKRVWQYRRYFRHWSGRNSQGRRFEIARRYSHRLDNFVVTYLGARSVTYARELIKRGHVFVNGEQHFNITTPIRQTEIVSLSRIAHMWLAQPAVNRNAANYSATRFTYYADVEDRRVIYGRNGSSAVLQHKWVNGGIGRFGGRLQWAGSLIEGLAMWRR